MFRVGKVINYYEKIGMTIVEVLGTLTVGDTIKIYKDGEEVLKQLVKEIYQSHQKIPFAKQGDVIGLTLNEKVQKGSEIYRESGMV